MGKYRAISTMGKGQDRVVAGEEFEAEEGDKRIRKGHVIPLDESGAPAEVDAAFAGAEGAAGDSTDPRGDAASSSDTGTGSAPAAGSESSPSSESATSEAPSSGSRRSGRSS